MRQKVCAACQQVSPHLQQLVFQLLNIHSPTALFFLLPLELPLINFVVPRTYLPAQLLALNACTRQVRSECRPFGLGLSGNLL